ncbi:MAG: lipopolysaccharide biosynthesis protein [Gemmatimonadota bacterium]|nr:lipopolysaccharide biosynthesis protein [Gemmatimonadota bacterium]
MPEPNATHPAEERDQLHRVGSQTVVYTLGVFVGRALSFVLLPVYTRYLSPADYGIIQLVELTFDVLTLVAGTRIASGLFHFHEKAPTVDQKNAVLSTTMIALAVGYVIVAAAALVLASTLSRLVFDDASRTTVVRIAASSFLFQGLLIVPLAEIRRREQSRLFVVVTSGKLVAQAVLNVFFLVVMHLGILSMFLSTLITTATLAIALTVYLVRQTGMGFSAPVLRDLLRFGLPLVATQIATIFTTFGDRFFLRRAVDDAAGNHSTAGVAAVGIYALAYQFAFLLSSVTLEPFLSVWQPVRFKLAKQDNRDSVFSRAFVMLNVLLVTGAVGIGLLVHDVLGVIAAPDFRSAADLVPLLLLATVIGSWSSALDTGILLRERTEYVTYANWLSAAVALVGYLVLIPPFQGWGAAWATLAALSARHFVIYWAAQRLWPIRYDWSPVWKLLAIGTAVVAVRLILPAERRILSISISVALLSVYALVVWFSDIMPGAVRLALIKMSRSPGTAVRSLFQDQAGGNPPVAVVTDMAAPPVRVAQPNPALNARVIRTITRAELRTRLDWGIEFFKNDSYKVLEIPAVELLNPSRFDLLAKTIFAESLIRGQRSDFGERIYSEHIRVWNGFHELTPLKSSRSDFVESFRALVATVDKDGFSPERPFIPIDRFGRIIDGAHRVAAGIAAGKTVRVIQAETAIQDRSVPDYDYQFFAENRSHVSSGLAEYYSDEMARAYCRLRPRARLVVLFPVGNRLYDARALEMLAQTGAVVYTRSFLLNEMGAFQFIRHLYQHDPRGWVGTAQTGYAGARDKAKRCFKALTPCRVVLVDPAFEADFLDVKQRLRALYEKHDAVHISDNPEELPMVSGFIFNRNSIDFFNAARPRVFERFDALFSRYSEASLTSGASREEVAVHGSACITAAGLRDCRDIDFVAFDGEGEQLPEPRICRRSTDTLITPEYVDSVIFDPANHFWYFGQKFATLRVVRDYKLARAEAGKDPHDVALIDQILRPTRWDRAVTSYFSMVGLQSGGPRDALRSVLDRTGVLAHVRRIRH